MLPGQGSGQARRAVRQSPMMSSSSSLSALSGKDEDEEVPPLPPTAAQLVVKAVAVALIMAKYRKCVFKTA